MRRPILPRPTPGQNARGGRSSATDAHDPVRTGTRPAERTTWETSGRARVVRPPYDRGDRGDGPSRRGRPRPSGTRRAGISGSGRRRQAAQPGRTTRVRRTTQALAHRGCPGHRHHVRRVLASPWPERSRALARRRLGGAVRSRRHRGGLAHVVHGTRLRLHRSHGPRAQPRDHDLGSDAFVRGRRRRHPRRVRAGPLFPFRPPGRAPRRRRARHSAAVRRLLHPGEGVRARHPAVVRCAGGGGAGPASAG